MSQHGFIGLHFTFVIVCNICRKMAFYLEWVMPKHLKQESTQLCLCVYRQLCKVTIFVIIIICEYITSK